MIIFNLNALSFALTTHAGYWSSAWTLKSKRCVARSSNVFRIWVCFTWRNMCGLSANLSASRRTGTDQLFSDINSNSNTNRWIMRTNSIKMLSSAVKFFGRTITVFCRLKNVLFTREQHKFKSRPKAIHKYQSIHFVYRTVFGIL